MFEIRGVLCYHYYTRKEVKFGLDNETDGIDPVFRKLWKLINFHPPILPHAVLPVQQILYSEFPDNLIIVWEQYTHKLTVVECH